MGPVRGVSEWRSEQPAGSRIGELLCFPRGVVEPFRGVLLCGVSWQIRPIAQGPGHRLSVCPNSLTLTSVDSVERGGVAQWKRWKIGMREERNGKSG